MLGADYSDTQDFLPVDCTLCCASNCVLSVLKCRLVIVVMLACTLQTRTCGPFRKEWDREGAADQVWAGWALGASIVPSTRLS